MAGFSKILKVLFILLLIITVGELGYYLYFQTNFIKSKEQANRPVETSTIISPEQQINKPTPSLRIPLPNYEKGGVVTSAVLTNYLEGQIIELDTKGGISPENGIKYQLKLVVQRNSDKRLRYYSEQDINKFKIAALNLKVGDNITIKETLDLLSSSNSNYKRLNLEIKKI